MNKAERLAAAMEKAALMRSNELKSAADAGADISYICGIDEVGRGPLAGPVAAGAVIFPADAVIPPVNDSKKLSAARRAALYDEIDRAALCWAVAFVSPERIDEINILQATLEAMRKAIGLLPVRPTFLIVDALTIPGVDIAQCGPVRADENYASTAAASIMAKVTRDRYVESLDAVYPGYGFASNKGYGTAEHINAIRTRGVLPVHRRSFIEGIVYEKE